MLLTTLMVLSLLKLDMVPGVGNNPTVVTTAININDLPSVDEI